jgi:uncharacterized protein (TIGR02145 family)
MKPMKLFIAVTFIGIFLFGGCKKDEIEFGSVTDIEGNIYKTVKIGTQWWMAENLKSTKYQNGDLIGTTSPATLDIVEESTPKYQWASGNDENNVAVYGRLYTWFALTDERNVCPPGWHIPTHTEWQTLETYLGGELVAGGKLKESGLAHWNTPNTGATNSIGFSALPAGERNSSGQFGIGYTATFWSSSGPWTYSWCRILFHDFKNIYTDITNKRCGFSARCVKDE